MGVFWTAGGRFPTFAILAVLMGPTDQTAPPTTPKPPGALRVITVSSAAKLQDALDDARPGDWILVSGTVGTNTKFVYSKSGTPEHPIVVSGAPGTGATISGGLVQKPNGGTFGYFQVVGDLLLTQTGSQKFPCLQMVGPGQKAVNLTFVGCEGGNGLLMNDSGPGQEAYGNVIRDSDHGIYVQNSYANSYKPIRRNIFLADTLCHSNCFSVHGYSEKGSNAAIWLDENIFAGAGRWILGGTNPTTKHEKVTGNVHWQTNGQIGYQQGCGQLDAFTGNVFLKAGVQFDPLCYGGDPNIIRDNEFYNLDGATFNSVRYRDATKGQQNVNPGDVWDGSRFLVSEPGGSVGVTYWFKPPASLECCRKTNLAKWRSQLAAAGCAACEKNASEVTTVPSPRYWLTGNDYEAGRGQLAVLNWDATGSSIVPVSLAPVVTVGAAFTVTRAEDMPYGPPALSGTYSGGDVVLPLNGPFQTFIVRSAIPPAR
jgi:hypothetical protein